MNSDPAVLATWRQLLPDASLAWVLYGQGTCVLVDPAPGDLEARALAILRRAGPVQAGTASADFEVHELDDLPGWVVTCSEPAILVHVRPEQVGGPGADTLDVGLVGRDIRDRDARAPQVVAVHRPQT